MEVERKLSRIYHILRNTGQTRLLTGLQVLRLRLITTKKSAAVVPRKHNDARSGGRECDNKEGNVTGLYGAR